MFIGGERFLLYGLYMISDEWQAEKRQELCPSKQLIQKHVYYWEMLPWNANYNINNKPLTVKINIISCKVASK